MSKYQVSSVQADWQDYPVYVIDANKSETENGCEIEFPVCRCRTEQMAQTIANLLNLYDQNLLGNKEQP